MFTLKNTVTGEHDSDWHTTRDKAEAHRIRCRLSAQWVVVELTEAQFAEVYA